MMTAMAARAADGAPPAGIDLAALHRAHYRELVKLASFLIDEVGRCEELVQEAFARLAARPTAVREPERAPAYLRSAVLNGARSVRRRRDPGPRLRIVAATALGPEQPDAAAGRHDEEAVVLAALRSLPQRQQEVLVLRYWLDLPEHEIAATLGIGGGTVKTHARRGLAALAARLEDHR
jgi:RNA polymerase sigma-70 factor (sigma-E family)